MTERVRAGTFTNGRLLMKKARPTCPLLQQQLLAGLLKRQKVRTYVHTSWIHVARRVQSVLWGHNYQHGQLFLRVREFYLGSGNPLFILGVFKL
jgi:hypothetical protein